MTKSLSKGVSMIDLQDTLQSFFGYEEFRPYQESIIKDVMDGKDTVVLLPTGGGKSLCYQLPALLLPGLTIVVSPLIALMKDQVDQLRRRGISSAYFHGQMTYEEKRQLYKELEAREVKLLYVAPERLAMDNFQSYISTLDVSLIAIDEAHCISEWGHEFRPDYRELVSLREAFKDVPIVTLTATATVSVLKDIAELMRLKNPKMYIGDLDRKNLDYIIKSKQRAFEQMVPYLKKYKGESIIIYRNSRDATEKLAASLRGKGYKAIAYHAGLEPHLRRQIQEDFLEDRADIIVATVAFGMGIDKPDIRLIVHYDLPKSIESYYQETGRAGRDGRQSECLMFYTWADVHKYRYFIDQMPKANERERSHSRLNQVIKYCELVKGRRDFLVSYFGLSQLNNSAESSV